MGKKKKIIFTTILLAAGILIILQLLGKDTKLLVVIGIFSVFLEYALLDPPSRHREFTFKHLRRYKGSFASPGGSDPDDENPYDMPDKNIKKKRTTMR